MQTVKSYQKKRHFTDLRNGNTTKLLESTLNVKPISFDTNEMNST